VPDMHGKTVVVTGGNSGIGLETAAALATMGARVLVAARNADKGRAAVADISRRNDGHAQVQLVVFDLADLAWCGAARRKFWNRRRGSTCSSTTPASC